MDDINLLDRARAEEAFRRVFGRGATYSTADSASLEIAAMLARTGWEPEDPDLIAAREIVAEASRPDFPNWSKHVCTGEYDDHDEVKLALAAIKRGRELERGGR